MVRPVLLFLILAPLSAKATHFDWVEDGERGFRSPEAVHQTNTGTPCFRRVYLPPELDGESLRGVIVWDAEPHYHPNGKRSTIQSEPWRRFASEMKFAMAELATRPLSVEATADEIQRIFEDMDKLFRRSDTANAFFTFGGTSGTGMDTIELSGYEPMASRMIAGVPCSIHFGLPDPNKDDLDPALGVPLLVMPAGREKFDFITVPIVAEAVSARVSRALPDTLAVRLTATHPEFRDDASDSKAPLEKHQVAASLDVARTWLRVVIDQRLEGAEAGGELKALSVENGWLGSFRVDLEGEIGDQIDRGEAWRETSVARYGHVLSDLKIAPFTAFEGGLEAADTWFPNEAVAKAWEAYHVQGVSTVAE